MGQRVGNGSEDKQWVKGYAMVQRINNESEGNQWVR